MGPLIPLFWTSGYVCSELQSQGGTLACVLHCPCVMDSSNLPLVWHLLTSWWPVWWPSRVFWINVLALVITSIGGTRTQHVPYLYTNVYGIYLVQYFPAYYPRLSISHSCHSRDQSLATSQQPMQLDKGPVKRRISEHQMHSAHFIIHCCGCNLLAMLQAKEFFKRKFDWIA